MTCKSTWQVSAASPSLRSMTGKLVYLVSNVFVVHWEELATRLGTRSLRHASARHAPGIPKRSTWVCCCEIAVGKLTTQSAHWLNPAHKQCLCKRDGQPYRPVSCIDTNTSYLYFYSMIFCPLIEGIATRFISQIDFSIFNSIILILIQYSSIVHQYFGEFPLRLTNITIPRPLNGYLFVPPSMGPQIECTWL